MASIGLYIGTVGWRKDTWLGRFYPKDSVSGRMLEYYASFFNCVETYFDFQNPPPFRILRSWRSRTPDAFRFAITINGVMAAQDNNLSRMLLHCENLGGKLGPIVLRYPLEYGIDNIPHVSQLLDMLPGGIPFFIEMRNREWGGDLFHDMLAEKDVGLLHYHWGRFDPPVRQSGKVMYARFGAPVKGLGCSDEEKMKGAEDMAFEIGVHTDRGGVAYCFFSDAYEGLAPESALKFKKNVAKKTVSR